MPILTAEGKSKRYVCLSETGVHIKSNGLTGTAVIECFDGETSMGNLKDETGTDYSFTADFDGLYQFRSSDIFQIVQTGGTPTTTRITVGGAKS